MKGNQRWQLIRAGFILFTWYAIFFEASGWAANIKGDDTGRHLWMGPVMFLLELLIYARQWIMRG